MKVMHKIGPKNEPCEVHPPPQKKKKKLLSKNILKEILFTLKFLNEELNSFHSYKKHRFGLL